MTIRDSRNKLDWSPVCGKVGFAVQFVGNKFIYLNLTFCPVNSGVQKFRTALMFWHIMSQFKKGCCSCAQAFLFYCTLFALCSAQWRICIFYSILIKMATPNIKYDLKIQDHLLNLPLFGPIILKFDERRHPNFFTIFHFA